MFSGYDEAAEIEREEKKAKKQRPAREVKIRSPRVKILPKIRLQDNRRLISLAILVGIINLVLMGIGVPIVVNFIVLMIILVILTFSL